MSSSDADDVDAVNGEADAAPAVSAPVKRGRGRPKKVENRGAHLRKENRPKGSAKDSSVKNGTSGTDEVDSDAPAPRKRGRPRKNVETDPDAAAEAVDVAPRKRGRPKKTVADKIPSDDDVEVSDDDAAAAAVIVAPGKRGRPRKTPAETFPDSDVPPADDDDDAELSDGADLANENGE